MNASEPRKVAPAHSPTDTAPDAVGPSVARVGALGRHLDQWESKGHETVGIDWLRRHFALAAADAVKVAPDGHAALGEPLPQVAYPGPNDTDAAFFTRMAWNLRNDFPVGGSNCRDALARLIDREVSRASITATDRAASDESRVALEAKAVRFDSMISEDEAKRVALEVEVERLREGLAASEHMRSVQKIDRTAQAFDRLRADNDALRVTVAERDATIARVKTLAGKWDYSIDTSHLLAALDGPDDRSGEAGLCSGSSTGVHLWIGRLAEDGPYRWCEWCKETRSLR